MYSYNPKKEVMKNVIYIGIILLIAIISTYKIYYKFQDDRNVNFNSDSFVITFHEKTGDKVNITKVTPVTDSVGLSSNSYSFSIKNNLTEKAHFEVRLVDDLESVTDDNCIDKLISKENIKVSIKNGKKENKIYNLNELEDGVLLSDKISALEEREISVRVWVDKNSSLPIGSDMHYHGTIKVLEDNGSVAMNK
ncbi:MAG: hypothetical protein PUG33_02625 [Mollicutes bacterium]|mgnify:FL=1|nr:hypothetical protein [Mollicutes bacterium]